MSNGRNQRQKHAAIEAIQEQAETDMEVKTASESIAVRAYPEVDFTSLGLPQGDPQIESIKLTHSQTGFSRRFVVVSVKIDGKWREIIRDLETSSNDHEVKVSDIPFNN